MYVRTIIDDNWQGTNMSLALAQESERVASHCLLPVPLENEHTHPVFDGGTVAHHWSVNHRCATLPYKLAYLLEERGAVSIYIYNRSFRNHG